MQTATTEVADLISQFISDVFPGVITTMLGWEAPSEIPFLADDSAQSFSIGNINGSIGFGGQVTGTLFFSVNLKQVAEMAGALLGTDPDPVSRESLDVLGELTNMLAGGIKTRLQNRGYSMVMSIPNIIRGPQIRVAGKDVEFKVEREFALGSTGDAARLIVIGRVSID
jgi:chemotaxis protein CheX